MTTVDEGHGSGSTILFKFTEYLSAIRLDDRGISRTVEAHVTT